MDILLWLADKGACVWVSYSPSYCNNEGKQAAGPLTKEGLAVDTDKDM